MNDDQLLTAFESCTLDPNDFPHREHVHLAWIYFRREPPLRAITAFCEGLKKFATSLGKEGLYHETITWAYLLLIRDRIARTPTERWEEFAGKNSDLLTWKPSILDRYYRPETLHSDLARREFLFPDHLPEGGSAA